MDKTCPKCGREGYNNRCGHFWYLGQINRFCIDCFEAAQRFHGRDIDPITLEPRPKP